MEKYILDTSVVVKWYNREGEKQVIRANRVLHDLKEGKIAIFVPELLKIELVNVFLKGKGLHPNEIKLLLANFFSLPITIKESTEEVLYQTSIIAHDYNITAYDALFLALARVEDCQLISDDVRAHGKINNERVVMLTNY